MQCGFSPEDQKRDLSSGYETDAENSFYAVRPPRYRGRRDRTQFSHRDRVRLETVFSQTHYADVTLREELADEIGVTEDRIQVWFQNRRSRLRRDIQRQHQLHSMLPPEALITPKSLTNRPHVIPQSRRHDVTYTKARMPPSPVSPQFDESNLNSETEIVRSSAQSSDSVSLIEGYPPPSFCPIESSTPIESAQHQYQHIANSDPADESDLCIQPIKSEEGDYMNIQRIKSEPDDSGRPIKNETETNRDRSAHEQNPPPSNQTKFVPIRPWENTEPTESTGLQSQVEHMPKQLLQPQMPFIPFIANPNVLYANQMFCQQTANALVQPRIPLFLPGSAGHYISPFYNPSGLNHLHMIGYPPLTANYKP